ncbi:hypothetical protein Ancab_006661, partial [Ancistrocladus abbreviatus]
MLPLELQLRSHLPHISSSMSAHTFLSSFNGSYSPERSPNPDFSVNSSTNTLGSCSSSRSLKNLQYSLSAFIYNSRIAIALVPCAIFMLDLGGTPVIAFFCSSSLITTFNSIPLALLAAFLYAERNFLIGVWSSLQFKWIQLENPSIVLALERLLFACVALAATSIVTWVTVSAVGIGNAAYYLVIFNCVFYWLYSIPRISSFKSKQEGVWGYHGGEISDDMLIL